MPSLQKKFVPDYEEISSLIDGPYNEPSIPDEITEDDFVEEYQRFRDGLINKLLTLGKIDSHGSADFSVGHRTGLSRGVGVVVDNKVYFSPLIIDVLKGYVDDFPIAYVVALSGEHDIGEDFYIAITKEPIVYGTSEERKWLRPFGFY